MLITKAAVKRRSTVFALMLIFILMGGYSYSILPLESNPDIQIPVVLVVTQYEGVAPSDIESLITLPIERKLKGIKNVDEIRSVSSEGASMITIEFDSKVDIDDAMQWVRDKVDQAKGDLPKDLEQDPSILEINLSEFPIMILSVTGTASEKQLKELAEDLEDELDAVQGVLEIVISGGLEREIKIVFDKERLSAYGLSFVEILNAIAKENVNIPGGSVDIGKGKYLLRIPGEFKNPALIDNLVLIEKNGKPIYIKDIADVVDSFKDRESYSRYNGTRSITLSVKKRTGENIVDVADRVRAVVDDFKLRLPKGVDVVVTQDESEEIRNIVNELENNILSGLILVVLVLFLFLGKVNSVFVALAIPFSMLMTFIVLNFLGITLNMVVLFSLIIALGMLVDNAIVIVENIFRHMQEGKNRVDATLDAVTEVGWPVISSTITTLCAFGPMIFWPDIMGEFMKFLPITLIVTLTSSLFVALVINPVICATFMKVPKGKKDVKQKKDPLILRVYEKTLKFSLDYRWIAFGGAIAFMVIIIMLFGRFNAGVELMPKVDPKLAYVEIKAPEGTNLDTVNAMAKYIEKVTMKEKDIKHNITEAGVAPSDNGGSNVLSNYGKVTMKFLDKEDRAENSRHVLDRIREHLKVFPGAELKIEEQEMGPPTGAPISIEISGEDVIILSRITDQIKELIKDVPGLVDMKDNLVKSKPEIRVIVDREKAALLGVSTLDISNTVKAAISGYKLGTFREGEDEYDITARLPKMRRGHVSDVENLLVPTSTGTQVPLLHVAKVEMGAGYGSIRRIDSKRVVTITANTLGRNSNEVLADVQKIVSGVKFPNGYKVNYTGEQEEQNKAQNFLSKAFLMAIFLIALVLITQFNSVRQSMIVLTSVILSLTGVFIGLMVTRMPFSIIMTGIGVISLAGVVVNNAIVLIDYINQLRSEGKGLNEALLTAGKVRFRPVMLTAVTTIFGLLPMGLGISFDFKILEWVIGAESAQWWGPMAVAIIFGLAVATVLTLVVVPVLYSFAVTGFFKKNA